MAAVASNYVDFGDWVSPILVKEFRQGLRAPWFVGMFLWATVSMPLVISMRGFAGGGAMGQWEFAYWVNLVILLHGVFLIKGLVTTDEDMTETRLPLVKMTGYTMTHLMMCKWLSIMVQAGLILLTLLPYALVRYYMSVDITQELVTLGLMYLGCSAVAAMAVWLSTLGVIGRAVIGLVLVILLPVFEGATYGLGIELAGMLNRDLAAAGGYLAMWLFPVFLVFMFCMAMASAKYDDSLEIHHNFHH